MNVFVKGFFPSFSLYYKLFFNSPNLSVLRKLEYERLEKHKLSGKILDFGGGEKSRYRNLVEKWAEGYVYESVNIDKNINPTFISDESDKLPISNNQYDYVLSLNTLEHVYDIQLVVNEIYRVLKDDGKIVLSVPFIFRAHGHPDDYLRCTANWWYKTLSLAEFKSIQIEVLNWGPFTTASTISGLPGPFKTIRLHFNLIMDILYTSIRYSGLKTYTENQDSDVCSAPLGYFITARKNS